MFKNSLLIISISNKCVQRAGDMLLY